MRICRAANAAPSDPAAVLAASRLTALRTAPNPPAKATKGVAILLTSLGTTSDIARPCTMFAPILPRRVFDCRSRYAIRCVNGVGTRNRDAMPRIADIQLRMAASFNPEFRSVVEAVLAENESNPHA